MRGTDSGCCYCSGCYRITPACAGNRYSCSYADGFTEDHPRVCGEQSFSILSIVRESGSPPRVRGTAGFHGLIYGFLRITPACAGNSGARQRPAWPGGDHPRVCGEQCTTQRAIDSVKGSPPRVRGTEVLFVQRTLHDRITPACAGNRLLTTCV